MDRVAVQAELYQRLKAEGVKCDVNVACNELRLDIALQTREYIYGYINVSDMPPSPVMRNGLKARNCASVNDVPSAVEWAKSLYEQHEGSQAALMLA